MAEKLFYGKVQFLDLHQCTECPRRFLSEPNQGSVDLKFMSPLTKDVQESKCHPKINRNYTWKFVKTPGNIMEKSWNFVIAEKWESCGTVTIISNLTYHLQVAIFDFDHLSDTDAQILVCNYILSDKQILPSNCRVSDIIFAPSTGLS